MEDKLGEGTYATVHLARCPETGETRAAKVIYTANLNPWSFEQLQSEVKIWSQLSHPNICKLHGAVVNENCRILVMELANGGELFNYLERQLLSANQAASVIKQILSALNYLHTQGILHRDIKPENVLICDQDSQGNIGVKIADFGASKQLRSDVGVVTPCGSMGYAAPEMMQGVESYGPACDIWSVGVLAYILLSGTMPYDPDNYCKGPFMEPRFPKETWQGIDSDAIDFVRWLLQLSPANRPSAGEALRHDWLNSTPPPTPYVKPATEIVPHFQEASLRTSEYEKVPCKDRAMNSYSLSTVHPVGILPDKAEISFDSIVQVDEDIVPILHLPCALMKRLEARRASQNCDH